MSESIEIRDAVVKREQEIMRRLIRDAREDGAGSVERAMAMFMEADTYLRSQGIIVKQPTHGGGGA